MRPASLRDILERAGNTAFLVTDPLNIRFLSGVQTDAGALLIMQRRAVLFVDALSRLPAEQSVRRGITIRDRADLFRVLKNEKECGFEADNVTVGRRAQWKRHYPGTKFIPRQGIVEESRRQKNDGELRCIRRAQRITKELLRRIPATLRVSVTEEKLARQLQIWALELGADGMAFDPIVAFGTHTGAPHHQPTTRTLKRGHIVQIDVGVKVHGYCADMSRVFFTGKPTPQQKRVYEILLDVQARAIAAAKAGVTTHALDKLVRDQLRKGGLEEAFCHSLGHGLGLSVHEGVTLSQKRPEATLLPGEVITIEPGVYFPGKFGMRVEDMVYVA